MPCFKPRISFFLALLLLPTLARAGNFYFEPGFGATQLRQGDPFFPGAPQVSRFNLGYSAALMTNFGNDSRIVEFHGGLISRYSRGNDGTNTYSLITAYPYLRIQFSTIFIGVGVTPFIYRSSTLSPRGRVHGIAGLSELGVLWPMTPKFSLSFSGGLEMVNSPSSVTGTNVVSPKPALEITAAMRFYFGSFGSAGGTSNEFKGWRYPFGSQVQ